MGAHAGAPGPVLGVGARCRRRDAHLGACLTRSANAFARRLRRGAPELGYPQAEPIIIDEVAIRLGGGDDGYRADFRDIHAYGVSNLTVTNVRSDLDTLQFQLSFYVPRISARARYRSSGKLLMMQASEGVRAKVYFRAHPVEGRDLRPHLVVDDLKMDFSVKDIRMGIENLHNGNTILQAALNLFINTHAQDLLKEMKPDLKRKLMVLMRSFMENLFNRIPYDAWIAE
ncbi:Circadian clock-controlled protein [Gryllus bimaculatus]|nr:Circadian clock-controlled protein [Gryllus bimaculatus]